MFHATNFSTSLLLFSFLCRNSSSSAQSCFRHTDMPPCSLLSYFLPYLSMSLLLIHSFIYLFSLFASEHIYRIPIACMFTCSSFPPEMARCSYSLVQHGTVAKAELCVRCLNPCACFTSHSESKKEISGGSGFGISNRKNYRSKLAKGGILVDLGRNRIIITVIHFY